jgi:hypothetical protein
VDGACKCNPGFAGNFCETSFCAEGMAKDKGKFYKPLNIQ